MIEIERAELLPGLGLVDDTGHKGKRGVTLLSVSAWTDVCRELGRDLPWTLRRANLLVEGLDLASAVGQNLKIGEVSLIIHGETKPCGLMDRQHAGLKQALSPAFRGGVHAEIIAGGVISRGQTVALKVRAS